MIEKPETLEERLTRMGFVPVGYIVDINHLRNLLPTHEFYPVAPGRYWMKVPK